MSEENFNNQNSDALSSESNNTSTAPQTEYRFWAEQASNTSKEYSANQSSEPNNYSWKHTSNLSQEVHISSPNFNYEEPSFTASTNNVPIKKRNHVLRKVFAYTVKAAVFGVIAASSFVGFNSVYYHYNPDAKPISAKPSPGRKDNSSKKSLNNSDSNYSLSTTTVTEGVNITSADVSGLVEDTMPATVSISSKFNSSYYVWGQEYSDEQEGGGSGIIIGKEEGELLIATNNHVVEDSTSITITFIDGTTATGIIKGRDANADLALLSIDTSTLKQETLDAIKVAKLGDSESIKVGQMVVAIGNALGYGQSVTVGYISATEREISLENNINMTVLQTDAAINPGNSGGALINMNGEVIGINSAKLADTSVEGIGYAIPISNALPIVNDLMTRETLADADKGYLGVYPTDVNQEVATAYNWPIGVYVYDIVKDGAADQAGILKGDIITSVNDETITTSEQLREYINSYRYGTKVTVTLQRMQDGSYKEMKIDVVLQKGDTSTQENNTDSNSSNSSNSQEDGNSENGTTEDGTTDDDTTNGNNNQAPGTEQAPNINGETPGDVTPNEETDPFGDLEEWFNNFSQ